MRTRFIVATSLAALLLATGASATYQNREFDPSTVTTMTVEVVAIEELPSARGSGLHLRARADDEEVDVRLGPAAEIMTLGFAAQPGDTLVVTGSRLEGHGMTVLVASEIERDGHRWQLRSAEGVPVWAGRGQDGPADNPAAPPHGQPGPAGSVRADGHFCPCHGRMMGNGPAGAQRSGMACRRGGPGSRQGRQADPQQ